MIESHVSLLLTLLPEYCTLSKKVFDMIVVMKHLCPAGFFLCSILNWHVVSQTLRFNRNHCLLFQFLFCPHVISIKGRTLSTINRLYIFLLTLNDLC